MEAPDTETFDIEDEFDHNMLNENEGNINDNNQENFGFIPAEIEEKEKEKKVEETPEVLELREKICQLLSRYPELVPRSSVVAEEALKRYELSGLKNIYNNCLNDLQYIRGTPSSEFIIFIMAGFVDSNWLPGYLDMCQDDEELKRDVESELYHILYYFGTKVNILFRFLNNAYKIIYNRRTVIPVRNPDLTSKFVVDIDGGQDTEPREKKRKRGKETD